MTPSKLTKQSIIQPPISISLNLTSFTIGRSGENPGASTSGGYELRSCGPATLDAGALDIILLAEKNTKTL